MFDCWVVYGFLMNREVNIVDKGSAGQSIVFTKDPAIVRGEKDRVSFDKNNALNDC